ncbi:LysR substrate-binding domain-containing protein [Actinocatenispora rupis]|uniref:Transcriptional regulator n=1 Tax=Actinocatenispora rupis TaxID=519421 RepID=A0A8J3NEI6_9ACTN|nr:LysR substrate-binding domain-containing protein [Actinocatenispora rupis]GID16101.1 transcriptional regulator [Actinocatenispora rupis]
MNLTYLRAFHAVATEGSFVRAAASLHVSQPTLSEQVRALERAYGVLLFERAGRRVTRTELGTELLDVTRQLFGLADDADRILGSARELHAGRLRICADAPVHVMPLLAALRDRHPGVRVALTTGNSEQSLTALRERRVDVAITASDGATAAGLHSAVLRRDPVVAYVSHRHPLADRTGVELAELARHQLIVREHGSTTRRVLEQGLAAVGRSLADWPDLIEVDSREAVHAAVAVGLGVGVVTERELPHDPRVGVLDLTDLDLTATERLVCRADGRRSRLVRAVFDLAGVA